MDLEMIIVSVVGQTKTNIWYHLHVESEKNDTNELIYKTETDPQTKRMNLYLSGGQDGVRDRSGIRDWHIHTAIFKIDIQQVRTV